MHKAILRGETLLTEMAQNLEEPWNQEGIVTAVSEEKSAVSCALASGKR